MAVSGPEWLLRFKPELDFDIVRKSPHGAVGNFKIAALKLIRKHDLEYLTILSAAESADE
jgi:hypothetical protein